MLIEMEELTDEMFRPAPCILEEQVSRGSYSRLADEVRRVLSEFRHVRKIVVSQNAPDWRREANVKTVTSPKGLTTIKDFDINGVAIVHYKTATKGHRAKVFVKARESLAA